MVRVLITGSSDGLGSLTARALVKRGHSVVLHARNDARAEDARTACPGADTCLVADLSDLSQIKKLAEEANRLGPFDALVHNAGLYLGPYRKTNQSWPSIFAVNTAAPYVLTCLIRPTPKRLVFVSSSLHTSGHLSLKDMTWTERGEQAFQDMQAYADSKLHNILLAYAFARKWPTLQSNSLDPGWVPTKMGGISASGDIKAGVDTYVMLVEGGDAAEGVTGKHWFHSKIRSPIKEASNVAVQDRLVKQLEELTDVKVPDA